MDQQSDWSRFVHADKLVATSPIRKLKIENPRIDPRVFPW
jgi:hypothetical protein